MKQWLSLLLGLAFCFGGPSPVQAEDPAFKKQPNIILVITDDQGYYDLSCHGNPQLATPNLDTLRDESLRFTRFQVSPTCAPTRSAIMSGRAPFYVGVTHTILERERMKLGVPTLPEMLRDAGYTTGIFGKWHLGDQDPYRPDKRGFEEVFIHGAGGIGQSYSGSCGDAPGNKYFDPTILHNNAFVKTKGFCTDIFFNQAMKWMEAQQGKQPFFAYITTNAPHGPYIAPDSYKKKFIDAGVKENTAGFYGMIENIDDNVGRLTAKLAEWGIEKETLLIFITDNGPAASNFNGDHKGKKGSVDEGGTRVPSFWRWPGVLRSGTDVDRIANHYDILPTFAAIAGGSAKQQDQLHGRSLVPLLKDPRAPWEDRFRVFHQGRWKKGQAADSRDKGFAVRNQRFRLVGRNSLFDMQQDPSQQANVIADHPEIAKKLNAAYDKWFDGALPNMVNEDAPLTGHNTFHLKFWKQYGMEIPPVKQHKPKPPKEPKQSKVTIKTVATTAAATKPKRPNILFIIADDQSPFDLKVYDPKSRLDTPTIDRLASEGMAFDAAYHMGSWSGAVCTPSRHMIMSGRSVWHLPGRNPNSGNPKLVPADLPEHTMAAIFNQAGYDTMRTCKKGNSYEAANKKFTVRHDSGKRGGTDETGSAWHAEQVLTYLSDRQDNNDSDPFLIYYGFSHPHDPRNGKVDLLAKYGAVNHTDKTSLPPDNPLQPPLPVNYLQAHPFHHGHPGLRDEVNVSGVWEKRDERTIGNELGREFACSENIDIQVGRVLAKLDEMGELDNTYIFYTSDHGMAIGRHGLQGKQNLYEHTWRVPFIVKGPGIEAGSRAKGNIYLLDVLGTLCDLASIEAPQTVESRSFRPVLEGKQETVRDVLYGVYSGGTKPGMRSVRKGDWKLIKYDVMDGAVRETQLFNLTNNPNEFIEEHGKNDPLLTNLATSPTHADKLAEMETLLLAEMRRFNDPYRLWSQPDDGLPPPKPPKKKQRKELNKVR